MEPRSLVLALTSNALGGAVSDPYRRLETLFKKEVKASRRIDPGPTSATDQQQANSPQQSDDEIVLA
jgi:D-alanyl-D-alanine carboxypeptidase/D-alanyl-D-alanine-endopeptidase (penicillin-binding protein 4)